MQCWNSSDLIVVIYYQNYAKFYLVFVVVYHQNYTKNIFWSPFLNTFNSGYQLDWLRNPHLWCILRKWAGQRHWHMQFCHFLSTSCNDQQHDDPILTSPLKSPFHGIAMKFMSLVVMICFPTFVTPAKMLLRRWRHWHWCQLKTWLNILSRLSC